jgi:hypothetical protein
MTIPNGTPAPGSPSAPQPLPAPEELRLLVRELLREVLAAATPPPKPFDVPLYGSGAVQRDIERVPEVSSASRDGAREVRLADDADLAAFVAGQLRRREMTGRRR